MALSDVVMSRIRMNMNIMDAVFAIKTLNNLAELQRLIETEGVPVDSTFDGSGETLLMLAVFYGRTNMIRYLISKGANVNIKDAFGNTAAHKAAFLGHIETLKLLLENGANVCFK